MSRTPVQTLHDLVDIARETAEVQGFRFSCSTCTDPACCELPVETSSIEVEYLLPKIRSLAPNLRERLEVWRSSPAGNLAVELETKALSVILGCFDIESYIDMLRDYAKLEVPCVFLQRGRCSIYEYRPYQCRKLLVVSDPVICRRGKYTLERDARLDIDSALMSFPLGSDLLDLLLRKRNASLNLNLTLLRALQREDL